MKKLILFLSAAMLFAVGCNDDKNDGPDNSLAKAVEGTYPVVYTIEGVDWLEPTDEIDSYATAFRLKGATLSTVLTMYQRNIPTAEQSYVLPAENVMFEIGLPLAGQSGMVTFRNPLEDEDNLYQTTVYIGEVEYKNALIKIEGEFKAPPGNIYILETSPSQFIYFTATIYPALEEGMTEDPDPIIIRVSDSRLEESEE